ncbi:hypothetical protein [Thorsellia anophelis]|uniref:Uncharacterized protein n=1 Tax=Thorsellia anophelis DSM 18579 TaxID=1123402 RepID=A0A1I0B7Y2_9GAMM|nr:hypothetical protein [Thorsellia anophelis]SET02901.1 hypothetical protein SAMN02583745_01177 [Thorsellia anophelis DSM 18579]
MKHMTIDSDTRINPLSEIKIQSNLSKILTEIRFFTVQVGLLSCIGLALVFIWK